MNVSIYTEPATTSLGGADVLAANLASMLCETHQVEIVHHRASLEISGLAAFAGVNLAGVTARHVVARRSYFCADSASPLAMYSEPRKWGREVAGRSDVLISIVHQLPPFNPTPKGILMLLFPLPSPFDGWPFGPGAIGGGTLRASLGRAFYRAQYDALWRGYSLKLAISEFAARWAQRRWRIDCSVLYPIVDHAHADFAKENLIVTLGRFTVSGVSKRQDELARAFSSAAGLADWRLACLGEAKTEEELRYVANVRSRGKNVEVRVSAPREEVLNCLGRARIFWHAAGLFEDEDQRPERLEHFGISTVEAMIGGCVPVVIGLGGQAEIVQHGQNGFLCQSLDEMIERSRELAASPELCERMSHAARLRAQAFSRASVWKRLRQLAPFV